jgi:hypothetical protein
MILRIKAMDEGLLGVAVQLSIDLLRLLAQPHFDDGQSSK